MYGKYVIEHWVLHYSRFRQTALFRELLENTLLLVKFSVAFLMMTFLSFVLVKTLQKKECGDKVLCSMKPLLKQLNKVGLQKSPDETMCHFLKTVQFVYPAVRELTLISTLYQKARYDKKSDQRSFESLKKEVAQCVKKINKAKI